MLCSLTFYIVGGRATQLKAKWSNRIISMAEVQKLKHLGNYWAKRQGSLYCWWFRNPANQLRLVVYPSIWRVLYIPGGCLGFLNHQQYDTNPKQCTIIAGQSLKSYHATFTSNLILPKWVSILMIPEISIIHKLRYPNVQLVYNGLITKGLPILVFMGVPSWELTYSLFPRHFCKLFFRLSRFAGRAFAFPGG